MFEEEIAEYAGAPYAISVDSCTNALFLCCVYLKVQEVIIPKKTYLSVPQAIMHAGGKVKFEDSEWGGVYQLKPYPIYDAATRFTSGMYIPNSFMCLSFSVKKFIKIGKGGMILTDNEDAVRWFKKARYEGRQEINYTEDNISALGWNMYMTPMEAAFGLMMMMDMPKYNEDLSVKYPDLTQHDLFKGR